MTEKNAETVVEIKNLIKVFKDFWRRPKVRAIDGVNMEILDGEIFGLLGPNGSGKSTTIKILLGLLYPTSGSVNVLGRPPLNVSMKHHIGYLPEESYLYNYLTPRETLDFYGRLFNMDSATRKDRTDQLLEMVGLTHAANRRVGEFSKGMARRVGLAQSLINDPKLVILDEPTSGLDPIGCRQVKDLMLKLAERGKTVLLSSHLLADVEDVCDRVAILYNGKVRATGSVNKLLEKQDKVNLTVPLLDSEKMKSLLASIRERIGTEPEVSHPSMNLEQFFLKVVREAYGTSGDQTGVGESKGLADYLGGGIKEEANKSTD